MRFVRRGAKSVDVDWNKVASPTGNGYLPDRSKEPLVSISIYYTARRKKPLTATELAAIDHLVQKYAVEGQLAGWQRTGSGYNWESFGVYGPTEPGIVFEGATKLPDNSEDALWEGLQHWCRLLSEIRRSVSGASWRVHVEDHDIRWDENARAFDPSK